MFFTIHLQFLTKSDILVVNKKGGNISMIKHIHENNVLTIRFLKYVSNDEWRVTFGKYQKMLCKQSDIKNLIIDFSECNRVLKKQFVSIYQIYH